jgi:hypothetical protein
VQLTVHLLCNNMTSCPQQRQKDYTTLLLQGSHHIPSLDHCHSFFPLPLILNSLAFLRPGDKPATNVSLVASCPSFIHVAPRNVMIQRIGGMGQQGTPIMVKIYLYATKTHLPTGAAWTPRHRCH